MTPALLDRPASLIAEGAAAGPVGGGRMTLEERLNAVLREACTNGGTECPVCHARMTPARAATGAAPAGAECGGCGSELS